MKKVFSTLILTFVLITNTYAESSPLQEEKNKQPIRDVELSASQASIQGIEE